MTGIEAFLDMLADVGVEHIFGNPGTTELPLSDALLGRSDMQYILALQECPALAISDGYAMAGQRLGVSNLHTACGLGNAMGMLYNAYREGTPLLVTAGQQDRRLKFEEPIIWADMISVVRPWTKWAVEVDRIQDLPSAIRRAVQTALTPPTGPVFMSLPLDLQMEQADLDLTSAAKLDRRVRPPVEALREAADVLLEAKNPAILVGSRVTEAGAVQELVALAEQLGAPVISESGTTHGRLGFPATHPHYSGGLPLWSSEMHPKLAEFDTLLVTGMDLMRHYIYHEPIAIPDNVRIVHLDEDPWQLGKNFPLAVGLIGDTKAGLAELSSLLADSMTPDHVSVAKQRGFQLAAAHEKAIADCRASIDRERDVRPITPLVAMESIARVLPDDVAVVEEAVTTTNTTLERLGALKNTDGYFGHRGWALGWGLNCAIGVQLAWPDRPVLGVIGDGSMMYGIQGLWTAAHYKIPVTIVVPNNAQYQILKIGARAMGLPAAQEGQFLGMDVTEPEIDFVALSESLGVRASRVSEPDELSAAVEESLAANEPRLIEAKIGRETPDRLEYG
jgi:benzoylformate decarboxylase